jgi:hypothetical protein
MRTTESRINKYLEQKSNKNFQNSELNAKECIFFSAAVTQGNLKIVEAGFTS